MVTQTRRLLAPDDAVDLHMHTLASDGNWTPETLIDYLATNNFKVVAVADHDSMASVPEMQERAEAHGIDIIPAVEMTTWWKNREVHCLVYGVETERPAATAFMDLLHKQQAEQHEMSYEIIELLSKHGRRIYSMDAVLNGRPIKPYMVYRAMIRDGHGQDLRTSHNIVKALGQQGYVNQPLELVIAAAHQAGAVAIIAHPGRDDGWGLLKEVDLDEMHATAPFDGVEAHYRSYTDEDTKLYRDYASERGLIVSSGSDSHAANMPVNPTPHPARWSRGLLERLGYTVEEFEGPAWVPPEPAAEASSNG